MRVFIDADEWYPVYSAYTFEDGEDCYEWGHEVFPDRETVDRWKRTFDEFRAVQSELREAMRS